MTQRDATEERVDRGNAVNLASYIVSRLDTGSYKSGITDKGVKILADAVLLMDRALSARSASGTTINIPPIKQTSVADHGEPKHPYPQTYPLESAPAAQGTSEDDYDPVEFGKQLAAVEAAIIERCAKVCQRVSSEPSSLWEEAGCWKHAATNCADAIRSMNTKTPEGK